MTQENDKAKILGRYIVADPKICHGKPTFRGTRIFVADILEQVAAGLSWEAIIEEWHDSITKEAIAEAVAEKMSALMTEDYLEQRAKRGSREKYKAILAKVPTVEPEEQDQLD